MFYINGLKKIYQNMRISDIIAGTSIGASNASIIMNHFLENKTKDTSSKEELPRKVLKYWEGSPERLLDFWKKISSHSILDYPLLFTKEYLGLL
jgi:NTE family protein